jgi:hypothetical protein
MAVSFAPSFLKVQYFPTFCWAFINIIGGGETSYKNLSAIINLTLRPPYAILLSDYPNG